MAEGLIIEKNSNTQYIYLSMFLFMFIFNPRNSCCAPKTL